MVPNQIGDLTPNDFTYGSNKKVWWLCPKGHSYEAIIEKRTNRNRGFHIVQERKLLTMTYSSDFNRHLIDIYYKTLS
jgi:hypothetical protein